MIYALTKEGREYFDHGLPEVNLVRVLKIKKFIKVKEAQELMKNFDVAVSWAKKHGWIDVRNGEVLIKKAPDVLENITEQIALDKIVKGEKVDDNIINLLIQRGLVYEIRDDLKSRAEKMVGTEVANLTPELIGTGVWRDVAFKQYNVEITGKKIWPGKRHHYSAFHDWVKKKIISLGFEEMTGPLIETEFWNMDALYMPQFHAARDIHGAYFVKNPKYAKSLDKKLLEAVKKSHEKGVEESRGWEYQYDVKRAHRLILRTQGTSLSARTLAGLSKKTKIPGKYFSIAKVFRPDVIDATHAADFFQFEGIVLDYELNFRHLVGLLRMFAKEFANTDKIKLAPSYFPFTEPSVELMAKHPEMGWIEIGGAGIFRPELTKPLGIDVPVLAWGLGIDRIGMFNMKINDIRNLISHDLNYLRNAKVVY